MSVENRRKDTGDEIIKTLIETGTSLVDPRVISGIDKAIEDQMRKRREGQPTTYEQMLIIIQENLSTGFGDTNIQDKMIPLFRGRKPSADWAAKNRISLLNKNVLEPEDVRFVHFKNGIYRPVYVGDD